MLTHTLQYTISSCTFVWSNGRGKHRKNSGLIHFLACHPVCLRQVSEYANYGFHAYMKNGFFLQVSPAVVLQCTDRQRTILIFIESVYMLQSAKKWCQQHNDHYIYIHLVTLYHNKNVLWNVYLPNAVAFHTSLSKYSTVIVMTLNQDASWSFKVKGHGASRKPMGSFLSDLL